MSLPVVFGIFSIFILIQNAVGDAPDSIRRKRCIVIQKQSGTHGYSEEGADDDDRRPQPKRPMPDRLRKPEDKSYDAEEISPELQRFKKRLERLRLKKPNKYSPY